MSANETTTTLTGNLFNRLHPDWDFATLVRDRLAAAGQGWTEEALALSIKNNWLAGQDARYEDILRDIRKVRAGR